MPLFGAIDPTGSERRWSACVLMDDEASLLALGRFRLDQEIVAFFPKTIWAVGLDAPCSLPTGLNLCCMENDPTCSCQPQNPWKGRACERDLVRMGYRLFYPTKNAFAKGWLRRGLRLKEVLGKAGIRVLEIYPHAAKMRLFGMLPPKASRQGRLILQENLRSLIREIPKPGDKLLSHHELDAILGAYTCCLHRRGLTEEVGNPEEGLVIVPSLI